jgi:hypothetical protein
VSELTGDTRTQDQLTAVIAERKMRAEDEVRARFYSYRPPAGGLTDMSCVRMTLAASALLLNNVVPEGREKALALTKLEEAMFWANAGIARKGERIEHQKGNEAAGGEHGQGGGEGGDVQPHGG